MEEILASIRKIIADDQTKASVEETAAVKPAVAAAPKPVEPVSVPKPQLVQPMAAPDDDILDLGQEATSLENTRKEETDLLFVPSPPEKTSVAGMDEDAGAMSSAADTPSESPDDAEDLLSNRASASVSHAFGSLAHTVLSQNARTVDDLVKDMLKPLLKGWLDDNLPTLVERLVRAEIERVARGGRG